MNDLPFLSDSQQWFVLGDDVNTLLDLSSPFFDLERERSKISQALLVRCRMEIVFIFTKSI